jgi:hypothetical protein
MKCHRRKESLRDLLLHCKTIDFGKGELSKVEGAFYKKFSSEIVSLCGSLPQSVRTEAMLFLMRNSGLNLGEELDFFANYYRPAWSLLYWLSQGCALPTERLKKADVRNAVRAQSLAMFLHSLDDHLTDGQIPVSPLILLLRSEAWTIMSRAWCNLARDVRAGKEIISALVDDYYSSLQDSGDVESLDSYCDHFRRQMATWMIAPRLLSMKMTGISEFTRDIEIAYGSFGVAWRLLDDIRDIADDMETGAHSAIFLCLPQEARTHWKNSTLGTEASTGAAAENILAYVLEYSVVDRIKERICAELEAAASIVEAHDMTGLAREFRCLAHPLIPSCVQMATKCGA